MTLNDFAEMGEANLIEAALGGAKGVARGRAIDELARRSLLDQHLLGVAVEAISRERTLVGHRPPLGWLGAARILDSGDRIAIGQLLHSMDTWASVEQEDLLRLWAPRGKFVSTMRGLAQDYGWTPKFNLD